MRKIFAAILICGIFIFVTAHAEIQIVTGNGAHYMEDENETLAQAQEKAKTAAFRDAAEKAQIHVQRYVEMHNSDLTQDEIITITAALLYPKEIKYDLEEEFGVMVYRAELTAEIDTDKIPEYIELEIKRRAQN